MKATTTQKTLATTLILAGLLSGGGFTSANAVESTSTIATTADTRLTDISDEQINRYDRHVTTGLMGDFSIRSDSNLSPADKAILQQILTKSNQERREALSNLPQHAKATGNEIQSAGGGVIFHWWGQTLWLNNINSYRLSALLAGGAAISTVAVFITSVTGVGAVVAGGFAAAFAVVSAESLICNWNQRGINIHRAHNTAVWCTPR